MPLASASCAPVSTVPWELKGREGANQDAGDPENGQLVKGNDSQQPEDHVRCLRGTALPPGTGSLSDSRVVCVAESWGSWHLGLQGARAEEGGGQII